MASALTTIAFTAATVFFAWSGQWGWGVFFAVLTVIAFIDERMSA